MKKIAIITLTILLTVLLFVACNTDESVDYLFHNKIAVTGVTLNKASTTIFEEENETLVATVLPDNATNKNVTWKSSDESIATVDANGKVTAVARGNATITVTTEDGSKTASCEVTIINELDLPLTLKATENGTTISFTYKPSDLEYSLNGGVRGLVEGDSITIDKDDTVSLYRTLSSEPVDFLIIGCDKDCYVYGNVMSLIAKDEFSSLNTIPCAGAFCNLFLDNQYIKNHEKYNIVLPATTLKIGCYANMFRGCKKLAKAPELPAKPLESDCYSYMFASCESLTTAPVLPANTLVERCYYYMFVGCSNLSSITCLATANDASNCVNSWLDYVGEYAESRILHCKNGCSSIWAGEVPADPTWTIVDDK